jgi:hypothetical protein
LIVINLGIDKENKMAEYDIKASKFNDVDTVDYLIDLANQISKVVSDISFKHDGMGKWGVDLEKYPDGVCQAFKIFYADDLNNHIGLIEVSNYYRETDKPKYGISSININDGRNTYGENGQHKYSINIKNIVRVAKKVLKPFTFDQIADRHRRDFGNNIDSLRSNMNWQLRQNVCDGYQHLIDDIENLYHLDYKPKNDKFKRMIDYVMENKAKIDKYRNYNPPHYFVLVKNNLVQYKMMSDKQAEPITIQVKDELPDDIKGKLFVLDITEGKDFVEDIGLKQNDGAYWIIA